MSNPAPPRRKAAPVTFKCPNCGADVRTDALACPACGSDDETGWSDDTMYDGLELPDEAFDDEADERPVSNAKARYWQAVAAVVLIAIILMIAAGMW